MLCCTVRVRGPLPAARRRFHDKETHAPHPIQERHARRQRPRPALVPRPEHLGPWGIYLQQVDRVTPYLGPLARWVETLKRPKRALIVDVPIELDNGTVAHFEGYRVQHNTSRGPAKGGVRFHQDVTLSEVMALAAWMSI